MHGVIAYKAEVEERTHLLMDGDTSNKPVRLYIKGQHHICYLKSFY